MTPHGPWKIVRSHEVYRDPWLSLRRDDVIRPDGRPGTYSVVHLKPGVCVLAMDGDRNVFLTEEFHYGVGRMTIEAVSGGVEPGEDPLLTAQRELQEELGIEADEWADLGLLDPFTGSVVSPTRLYLARRLRFGSHAQEGTESIRCVKMPLTEAIQKVMDSEITHGPSCVVILTAGLTCASEFLSRQRPARSPCVIYSKDSAEHASARVRHRQAMRGESAPLRADA